MIFCLFRFHVDLPQSTGTELIRGPPELVQHLGVHIAARALHVLNLIWFGGLAVLLAYPSRKEGGNFLVQIISTCFPSRRGRGEESAPRGFNVIILFVER
jgi:hypothetical protein